MKAGPRSDSRGNRSPRIRLLAALCAAAIAVSACGEAVTPSARPTSALPSASSGPTPTSTSPRSQPPASAPAPPDPAPIATPTPAPSTAPSAATRWSFRSDWEITDVRFAPDGRVVVLAGNWGTSQSRVTVLDRDGQQPAGWPLTTAPGTDAVARIALGPEGSVFVATRGDYPSYTWLLHRYSSGGNELAGFPVELPGRSFCDLQVPSGAVAFIWCETEDEDGDATGLEILAIAANGSAVPGWPVRVAGSASATIASDERVFVQTEAGGRSTVTLYQGDGTIAPGWPADVGSAERAGSLMLDDRGQPRLGALLGGVDVCGEPTRGRFSALRPNGDVKPGWPIRVDGWTSWPSFSNGGVMYLATAEGRVLAYGRDGKLMAGWPARAGTAPGCSVVDAPIPTSWNGVIVLGGDRRATLVRTDGRVAPGWPVSLPGEFATECPDCTPSSGLPVDPAVGQRYAYVAVVRKDRPWVVAVDRKGRMPAGLQMRVGRKGDVLQWVRIGPDGRVWALVTRFIDDDDGDGHLTGTLRLVAQDSLPE